MTVRPRTRQALPRKRTTTGTGWTCWPLAHVRKEKDAECGNTPAPKEKKKSTTCLAMEASTPHVGCTVRDTRAASSARPRRQLCRKRVVPTTTYVVRSCVRCALRPCWTTSTSCGGAGRTTMCRGTSAWIDATALPLLCRCVQEAAQEASDVYVHVYVHVRVRTYIHDHY